MVHEEFPSLQDIKRAIPAKYFQPNLALSFYYVFRDIAFVGILFGLMKYFENIWILFPVYWFLQGTIFWAIFVLGHDCGHGSFARQKWICDIVGTILHSFILVPYHMWRLSHRHHHKNTGNIDKDEIFYPVRKPDNPTTLAQNAYFGLGWGWLAYLFLGYYPRPVSHFNVLHPMFKDNFFEVCYSFFAWLVMAGLLGAYSYFYGAMQCLCFYGVPWFVFASWLVITTFLHHNEPGVPWFSESNWSYVAGNISSVDRDYGVLHNITHSIGTHQVHHLFPKVPHYHLIAATKYFREKYPQFVHKSDERIVRAFIENFTIFSRQQLIDSHAAMHVYRK